MRRKIAMLCVVCGVALLCIACVPAHGVAASPRLDLHDQTPIPFIISTIEPGSLTPTPTLYPQASESPVPRIDAVWYDERNAQLKELIKRYRPSETDQQIETAILRMYIDPDRPMVALTFDDGPVPGVTDKILDILEKYNARATFFVCGWRFKLEENRDSIRRAVALGCEIGNHTWAHDDMQDQNYSGVRQAVQSTSKIIFEITGYQPRSLRPPGGHCSNDTYRVARENGMVVVLWSQSGNVHEYDPMKIAQNVEKQIVNGKELQPGDVILLHDTKEHMVEAVEIIVPKLIEEGYQLVTVWELLNCSGNEIVPGKVYWDR